MTLKEETPVVCSFQPSLPWKQQIFPVKNPIIIASAWEKLMPWQRCSGSVAAAAVEDFEFVSVAAVAIEPEATGFLHLDSPHQILSASADAATESPKLSLSPRYCTSLSKEMVSVTMMKEKKEG